VELVDKKRTYISRVENDGSNMTLKMLFEIVEKGLGGKVKISIQILKSPFDDLLINVAMFDNEKLLRIYQAYTDLMVL
jgi:hypothetical protein